MPPEANDQRRYPCRCCGFLTLSEGSGSYEVCPVCFWEDDPVQNDDPTFLGGANSVCLEEAEHNFIRHGVAEVEDAAHIRGPLSEEVPPPVLLAGLDGELYAAKIRGVKIRLLAIARSIIAGHIGLLDGCSTVAAAAFPLDVEGPLEDLLRRFATVSGEIDEYPVGRPRELWASAALAAKDAELREYEQRLRLGVLADCARLEAMMISDLTA
jgi:hypothetical protein